jgi:hypothetical protein
MKHTVYFCIILYRYESETLEAVVPADGTGSVSLNFTLLRDNPELWSSRNDYGLKENLMSGKYLSNVELRQAMAALEKLNPSVAELQAVSVATHPVTSLKLTHEVCIFHGVQFNSDNYHKTNEITLMCIIFYSM